MSTASLTAKYRPQTFEQVAGQDAVKTILSRAAAQDKVAPAYLFSGTRGVGKTTIARIFAKALNCVNGPAAEPCNECIHCRQITSGIGVDVIEIDAASHGKVDDARRLKEDIGYAPIECRYKVFIIDEAHMLTTQAFNALLKTLEEPPPHATFIMATTETHKFPATIISRCQHYTFKMLGLSELTAHLENILQQENIEYEKGAVSLIAKRGAGSVRDSMSLLGQVLALGNDSLVESDIRSILGLAGKDVFFSLMQAIHERDLVSVGEVVRQVLDQGLDLGFFIRELGSFWRNMFLLGQSGERAIGLLELSSEEAQEFMHWANTFDRSFVHACWQMTVDGQRKVLTSLEPALALELLLLNMANLPDLISMEKCGSMMSRPAPGQSAPATPQGAAQGGAPAGSGQQQRGFQQGQPIHPGGPAYQGKSQQPVPPQQSPQGYSPQQGGGHSRAPREGGGAAQTSSGGESSGGGDSSGQSSSEPYTGGAEYANQDIPMPETAPEPDQAYDNPPPELYGSHGPANGQQEHGLTTQAQPPHTGMADSENRNSGAGSHSDSSSLGDFSQSSASYPEYGRQEGSIADKSGIGVGGPRTFEGFLDYVAKSGANGSVVGLGKCRGDVEGNTLILTCANPFHHGQVTERESKSIIERLAGKYFGPGTVVEFRIKQGAVRKSRQDLRKEIEEHPDIARVIDTFGASIVSVEHRKK